MSAKKKEPVEPHAHIVRDPFSEPSTIPSGWEISAFFSPEQESLDNYNNPPHMSAAASYAKKRDAKKPNNLQ